MSTTIDLTKEEAEAFYRALNVVRENLVAAIGTISRKKSWRDSEKAMAVAERRQRLAAIVKGQDALARAYHLGGY